MMGKISLYGTIIGLVVILLLSVFIGEGMKGIIYILLALVGFYLFILLFSKLFSFLWFRVLFFAAIILFSYFYTKSLIYTVSLTGIIVILIISQSHLVNKKWRRVLEIISFISLLAIHEYIFT